MADQTVQRTTLRIAADLPPSANKMNERFIQSNVEEAHEELTKLLQHFASGEPLDFAGFHIAMAHAFHHLNSAWNGRNISDEDCREYTDETYAKLEAFPTDLPLVGDDRFWDLPEYEEACRKDGGRHVAGV